MKLGHLIRPLRAGDKGLALNRVHAPHTIELTSDSFTDRSDMPQRFTADGDGVEPGLSWRNLPDATAELLLVVQDPDAPLPFPIVHAIVTGIAPNAPGLPQGAWERFGAHGPNTFLQRGFLPPAPVPGHGPHHYVFQLFALDRRTRFDAPPHLSSVIKAIAGHVLACGVLVGQYERS
jgi:Raf kinase inhibitor-like YbhB/YbcL family protein